MRIDFRRFFGAVEAAGFTGPLALEIFSSTEYPDSLWRADPYDVAVKGRAAMELFWPLKPLTAQMPPSREGPALLLALVPWW